MASISKWLNEAHQQKMADLVIEDTLDDLKRRDSAILEPYVPFRTYSSPKFLAYVMEQINVIASVVAFGAETPMTRHGQFRKITAEMVKSKLGYVWDEQLQWDMKAAVEEARLKGITVQRSRNSDGDIVQTGANLSDFIFGTMEQLARSQVELLNQMTWQVLQYGKVDREDPRTGIRSSWSYLNPYGETATGANVSGDLHFPDPLAAGARWSEYATANGLQNLYDAVDQYVDTNGFAPDCIYMSRKLANDLMQQTSTKEAASSLTVTQVGQVSPTMLGALLDARGISPVKTFDEKFRNELSDLSLVNTRFLDENRFVFVKELMGERAMGPTLEGEGKEGVYVSTFEDRPGSTTDVTEAVATIVPVFGDPKLLYSQQVKDPA